MEKNWSSILEILKLKLDEGKFKIYLQPLKGILKKISPLLNSDGANSFFEEQHEWELCLEAANQFLAGQAKQICFQAIQEAGKEVLGSVPKITFSAPPPSKTQPLPKPITIKELARDLPASQGVLMSHEQLTLPISLPRIQTYIPSVIKGWKHSFEDFVVGPCNQLAYAAATNILENNAPVDMLFLSSASGLGKTHLTQAVGRALYKEADKRNIRMEYLSAEEFFSQFICSINLKKTDEFKSRFRNLDMLLLEDVHFLKGKDKTQEELLSTINALQARGGRVVLTSSFSPRDLKDVDSQLVSRFCSGFVASMEKPNRDTRYNILMEKARRFSVILPPTVAELLADKVTGDIRLLEGCLHNLMLYAKCSSKGITEEMAYQVIRNIAIENPSLSMEDVVRLVCRTFDLTPNMLASKSRRQNIVQARNTIFFMLRKHTDMTLEEIGDRFNRKHSTVIKGITNIEEAMGKHTPKAGQIQKTIAMLEHSLLL